jgi:hypothetical protein
MGLERHVDKVIEEYDPEYRLAYYWSNGMNVANKAVAIVLMEALDASGEFGPTRYNPDKGIIEFGTQRFWFKGTDKEYHEYCKNFWNFGRKKR